MPKKRREASSDGELLQACRAGDTEAFAALWERHRGAAIVAARSLGPGLDPDDLVSEAYLKIFELVLNGRGPQGAFRPYLYQVIRTAAVDRYRSPERTNAELDEIPDLHEAGPWEDNAFDLNAVSEAFASLDERWQAALWYTEVEQLPPRRAAALLGLSANATAALAVRAREALRSSWVEAHVNRELAEAECRTTLNRLQRYQRGKLTARASREVAAHLDRCESCSRAAAASLVLNRQLGLVLAGLLLGGVGTAGLFAKLGLTAQLGAATAAGAGAGGAGAGAGAGTGGAAGSGGAAAGGASAAGAAGAIAAPAAIVTGVAVAAAAAIGIAAVAISGLPPRAPAQEPATAEQSVSPQPGGSDAALPPEPEPATPTAEPRRDPQPVNEGDPTPQPPQPEPKPRPKPEPQPNPKPNPPKPTQPKPPVTPVTPGDGSDPSISVGYQCTLINGLSGVANEYGVIRLRVIRPGVATPIEMFQPSFDPSIIGGPYHDFYGNTFHFGFFTGMNPSSTMEPAGTDPLFWIAPDPQLLTQWVTDFAGLTLSDVTIELRLVTPDGRYSKWTAVDTGDIIC